MFWVDIRNFSKNFVLVNTKFFLTVNIKVGYNLSLERKDKEHLYIFL